MINRNSLAKFRFDLVLALFVLTPFLYIAATVLCHGVPDGVTAGDGALLEMSTRDVFSRGILLGPYSQFLFFHPGPLYYYIRFPFYMLMGQSSSSLFIATTIVISTCLMGAWYMIRKLTDKLTSVLFSAVVALFLFYTDKLLWLSDWNPHIILFPIMLFAVAAAAVGARHTKYVWPAVFAGSFVAQTHIGGIPVLLFSAGIALIFAFYPWVITVKSAVQTADKHLIRHIVAAAGLFLILWAPPLYEEFTAEPRGNLTKIREFFEDSNPDQIAEEAYRAWSGTVTAFELAKPSGFLRENGLTEIAPTFLIAIRLLLLSVSFALLRRKGKFGFLCALNLICLAFHGVTYISVLQIRGDINQYLIDWMRVVSPLSMFAILASAVALLKETGRADKFLHFFIWLPVVTVVYCAFVQPGMVKGYFRTDLHPSWVNEIAVRELTEQLSDVIEREPDSFYMLKLESWGCWPVLVGLMNSLEKQGYPIGMDQGNLFKSVLPPEGATVRILHLGNLDSPEDCMVRPVAFYQGFGVLLQ